MTYTSQNLYLRLPLASIGQYKINDTKCGKLSSTSKVQLRSFANSKYTKIRYLPYLVK